MKRGLTIVVLVLFACASPAFAEKPSWAGKGKPTPEQKQVHKEKMTSKGDYSGEELRDVKLYVNDREKKAKESFGDQQVAGERQVKGLEKQREKKALEEQKELGKSSEQGQDARQQRKKWWKFWGE